MILNFDFNQKQYFYYRSMAPRKNKYKGKTEQVTTSTSKIDVNQEQLAIEGLTMHQLLKNRTAKLRQMNENELCYILSTKWLRQWKEYVGYEQLTGEEETNKKDKKYGKRMPGKINSDIIAPSHQTRQFYTIPQQMQNYQYLNQIINQKKCKDDDYIAITKDIWQAFINYYQGEEIKRPIRKLKGSTFYDSQPLRCDVILANLDEEGLEERIKKTSKKDYKDVFDSQKMMLPTVWTIKELSQFFAEYCSVNFGSSKIHIWKGYSYIATNPLTEHLVQSIRDRKFTIKGRELTQQRYDGDDIDKYLKNTHTLIVEIGDILKKDQSVQENIKGYCQECVEKKDLIIRCMCLQVSYCSNKCRINDQSYHFGTCSQAFDSDDDEEFDNKCMLDVPLSGLNNLGNTCYMNSVIQTLLSLKHFSHFFTNNQYLKYLNQKQLKDNNCMVLRKLSKTIKGLIEEQSSYTPWPLKGQIDYNLTPFKGDKQHDANDFLINFLNLVNDYLTKDGDKAYNQIIQPFIGEFHSKVICPNCNIQNENNQIFLQVSLPIKQKLKQQLYQYSVVESIRSITKGKSQFSETWQEMRLKVQAEKGLIFTIKQPEGLIEVNESQKTPEKATKGLKGDLIYYKNIEHIEGQHIFVFSLITYKIVCGAKMKSPYGLPIPINVDPITRTLGTFWLQIIKTFFYQSSQIVEEAENMEHDYFRQIELQVKQDQMQRIKMEQQTNCQKKQVKQQKPKNEQKQKSSQKCQQIISHFNSQLNLFTKRIGIEVFVHDYKRYKGNCKFCSKKCSNCDLPKTFDKAFQDYFHQKYNQVKFEIFLRDPLLVDFQQVDKCITGQPGIQDCLSMFSQPEQLDQQNAWYCSNCDSMALAFKQLHIKTYPPLLILHLNRFKNVDGKKMKNSDPIQYQQLQYFGCKEYRLIGVVIHQGSMDAGHYWSICLRDGKYYIFNDSKVSQVDRVFNRNAYILLYERMDFMK